MYKMTVEDEIRYEATKEATKKITVNIVNNMKNSNYDITEISKLTGLSIEEIETM